MKSEIIVTEKEDTVLLLDELLLKRDEEWWTNFYNDKTKHPPFLIDKPDESLVRFINSNLIHPNSRILELGCGNGRNSIWLAENKYYVDAIDFSRTAISSAKNKIKNKNMTVNFYCESIFTHNYKSPKYDMVYDCGCFHHIPPHRRPMYIDIVTNNLETSCYYLLVCFNELGGSSLTDLQVYEEKSLKGGMAFSEDKLQSIFAKSFDLIDLRTMNEEEESSEYFGKNFL